MSAPYYSTPPSADEDFVFPEGEVTLKVKVRCRCGLRSVQRFQIAEAALAILGRAHPPPDLLCGSAWCADCHTLVKVTARALHLAE